MRVAVRSRMGRLKVWVALECSKPLWCGSLRTDADLAEQDRPFVLAGAQEGFTTMRFCVSTTRLTGASARGSKGTFLYSS